MGVTLERVQFKFASIIGELCSEPDILSQFAVWVDLRLAEYKLKGSISLDCSGDPPDPVWLKGILSALLEKRLQKHAQMTAGSPISNQQLSIRRPLCHSTPISQRNWGNSEGSGPGAPLPPVKINLHDQIRKRRAWEAVDPLTSTPEESDDNPNKSRKRGTEEDPITISHESLMSVIGLSYDDSTVTDGSPVKTEPGRQPHVIEENELNPVPEGERCAQIRNSEENIGLSPMSLHIPTWTNDEVAERQRNRATQTRCYVNKFEKWAMAEPRFEQRKIEDIPPEELDAYLFEFLSTVRSSRTDDYSVNSLIALRSGLERHLKGVQYPHSITTSSIFRKSQQAYRVRKSNLILRQNKTYHESSSQ